MQLKSNYSFKAGEGLFCFPFRREREEITQWSKGPTQKAENIGDPAWLCEKLRKQWPLGKEEKKNFQVEALNLVQEKRAWAVVCLCTLQCQGLLRKLKLIKKKKKRKKEDENPAALFPKRK